MDTFQLLEQQILSRYAIFDRPLSGEKNVIIDSFFPAYFLKSYKYNTHETFPVTAAAISEFAADAMQVPLVPRQDLIELLGYRISDIKRLLLDVKRKELTLCLLGLGGTNSNTLYWLHQLATLTNTPNLFNRLEIFENDTLSIDNLLRMPMATTRHTVPLVSHYNKTPLDTHRLFLSYDLEQKTKDTPFQDLKSRQFKPIVNYIYQNSHSVIFTNATFCINPISTLSKLALVTQQHTYLSKKNLYLYPEYFRPHYNYPRSFYPSNNNSYRQPDRNVIYYGAPDIATRQAMSNNGYKLITATHGDDTATLALNPLQDTSLQVESYGVIKLGPFFMNQLRLAIGLLETLASDQDLTETNKTLLDYSFTADTSKCKRTWKVQSLHDGLLRSSI